ncbi:Arc family DNA-binding protein [Pseudomonas sp. PDM11]|nr:Arc family DNA-binding protein [Pseudomonas sp. PDM11]
MCHKAITPKEGHHAKARIYLTHADKFVIRLPDGMRKAIEELATTNHSSMNTEMVLALEAHLESQSRQKLLLDTLQAQVSDAKVPAREQPQQQAEVDYIDGLKKDTH